MTVSSNSWLTSPVTKASSRAQLCSRFMRIVYYVTSQSSAEYFDHTGSEDSEQCQPKCLRVRRGSQAISKLNGHGVDGDACGRSLLLRLPRSPDGFSWYGSLLAVGRQQHTIRLALPCEFDEPIQFLARSADRDCHLEAV
jgi:hypothetical protein